MADHETTKESPLITELKWGQMTVHGFPPGKDFKLFPGGAEEWDWNTSNTRHVPGIQPQDVNYLLERGAQYIVLSRGMQDKLQTAKETQELLEEKGMKLGVDYFIETTPAAHQRYNELAEAKKSVGALIHSTC